VRASVNPRRREIQIVAGRLWLAAPRELHGQLRRISKTTLHDLTRQLGIDSLLLLGEELRDDADRYGIKTLAELLTAPLGSKWSRSDRVAVIRKCFSNASRLCR